jgi:hypothetical protein
MTDLTVAVTGAAGYRRFSGSGAGAAAGFASLVATDRDSLFNAENSLFEFQF